MAYKCSYCSRTFATPYALKRHISSKHQYTEDEGEGSRSNVQFEEEPGLWDDDDYPTVEEPGLWDDDLDQMVTSQTSQSKMSYEEELESYEMVRLR